MQKEIPILFSTDMVRAILAGRKTVTRRIVKPQPSKQWAVETFCKEGPGSVNASDLTEADMEIDRLLDNSRYGQPGDILWVRESWNITDPDTDMTLSEDVLGPRTYYTGAQGEREILWRYVYKASSPNRHPIYGKARWKPSIHMPKDAARIWLRVKDVRVERLQGITAQDAIAEGIEKIGHAYKNYYTFHQNEYQCLYNDIETRETISDPIISFFSLWASINGANGFKGIHSFVDNPWVWVVSFEVLSTTGKPETILSETATRQ